MLFSFIGAPVAQANYGQGGGPIVMDDVACTGNETMLMDCIFTANHNCGHNEDAGVRCINAGQNTCELKVIKKISDATL